MEKIKKKGYILLLIMIITSIILNFFFNIFHLFNISDSIFWLFFLIIGIILFGIEKDKHLYKKDGLQIIFIYTLSYLIIIYLIGLFIGFTTSPYSHELEKLIMNTIPLLLVIIFKELFRYIIISKNNIKLTILVTLTIIVVEVMIGIKLYDNYDINTIFSLISLTIIPSICSNILLSFICLKIGYKGTILYQVIINIYVFFIPIFPNLGIYLESVFKILLPTIIYLRINNLYQKQIVVVTKNKKKLILTAPFLLFSIITVILVSGISKYKLIAIASNSMYPSIAKGDIIVYKEVSYDKINRNDVLIYYYNKAIIVHRIINIKEVDNNYKYYTKGDNNTSIDNYEINENDVLGIKTLKIPYLGYPTILLSQLINRKEE